MSTEQLSPSADMKPREPERWRNRWVTTERFLEGKCLKCNFITLIVPGVYYEGCPTHEVYPTAQEAADAASKLQVEQRYLKNVKYLGAFKDPS